MGGGHMHVQQALDGNNYGGSFSAGVPALRGTSASSMGHGQSDASQSYARCAINSPRPHMMFNADQ